MHGLGAVYGNANVRHAQVAYPVGAVVVYERAVRGESDAQALCLRVGGQRADVGAGERLAAREQHHGHAERGQIVYDAQSLLCRKLALRALVGRIAVGAG